MTGERATALVAMTPGVPKFAGCWARITAVKPLNFAGVVGADCVARMNCCCWLMVTAVATDVAELVFSRRLANA